VISALGRRLRVLIAEDDATNCLVVSKMLREFAIDTCIATNGAQAVKAASEPAFDLVLMDVRMPEMDQASISTARIFPSGLVGGSAAGTIAYLQRAAPGRMSCGRVHEMVRYRRDERTKTSKTP
jgi:AmiR/NasT family two-component response regulator